MSQNEITAFEKNPFFERALQLRRWDDQAKDPDLQTPPLEHFIPAIENALSSAPASHF